MSDDHSSVIPDSPNSSVSPLEQKPEWKKLLMGILAKVIDALVFTGRFIGKSLAKLFALYSKAGLTLIPEKVRSPFIKIQPLSGRLGNWFQLNVAEGKKAVPIIICALIVCCILAMSSHDSRPGSTTFKGHNASASGISAVPGTWVSNDGVSAEVRFTFRDDGAYMVHINNTGSESTSYGKWRADGKNGNNINLYDDEQPMLGAVGGAAFPSGDRMRIGYGMVGVQTYKKE